MNSSTLVVSGAILACFATPNLRAQWVTFTNDTGNRLVAAAGVGTADAEEKDYAWADLDQDGDTDLVVASPAVPISGCWC